MFQFGGFPAHTYLIQYTLHDSSSCVFPHSEICGSKLICSSPQLIAAYHVLHRLPMPRHSPYALLRLNYLLYIILDILSGSSFFLARIAVSSYLQFHLDEVFFLFVRQNCFSILPFTEKPDFNNFFIDFLVSLYFVCHV